MKIKTKVFKLCDEKYKNLSELAGVMELSISQIYRVRQGKCPINEQFIVGAMKAFPDFRLDELFQLDSEPEISPNRKDTISMAKGQGDR